MNKYILLYRLVNDGCGSFEKSDIRTFSKDFLDTDSPTLFASEEEAVKYFQNCLTFMYNDGDIDVNETVEYGIFKLENLNQLNFTIELNFKTKKLKS